ncbi:MAG: hypothetical protein OXU21_08470 [Chloroflexota bacterium]|nr:hypothetical protein [Chloroflexota bacterium]
MSADAPQEPPQPTPEGRRLQLPSVSRNAAVIALALVALALGGAALGLSIANGLADDDRGPVAYVSRVEVGRWSDRFGPPSGYKPGFDHPPSRFGRGPFGKDGWDRKSRGKHVERSPSRADSHAAAGMVIAIGEVTGLSVDAISVFTILGNDVDIALPRAGQADAVAVGGWAVVMAERTADGLVARWVTSMTRPDAFPERARNRSAAAS